MIDLRAVAEPGEDYVLRVPTGVEVYRDRQARLSLGQLRRDRTVMVLAIDRHGLMVSGHNRAGPVTGWIGWRQALAGKETALLALERYYERLVVVERWIAKGQAALGMSAREIERALGTASSRRLESLDGKLLERMEWVAEEAVPLLTGLPGLARDEPLLTVTRETGRRSVTLEAGVATAVELSDGRQAGKIPVVPTPCPPPFEVRLKAAATD